MGWENMIWTVNVGMLGSLEHKILQRSEFVTPLITVFEFYIKYSIQNEIKFDIV